MENLAEGRMDFMKRILGFGILIVLIFNCVIVDVSVISDKETEIEENV